MKRLVAMLLALVCFAALMPAVAEEEAVVNVFTWETYLDEYTIAAFEAATGIKVQYANFASNEEMMIRLQANGGSEYDLVIASDYAVATLRKEGLLMALDKEQLTNWDNINPEFLGQYYDPEDAYAVPYTAGSPMIVYNPEKTDMEFHSFSDLWDPSLKDNVCLIDDARVIIGAVLKSLGYSYNTTDADQLAEAKEKLFALKDNVRVLAYDGGHTPILSGDVAVGYVFTPYAAICLQENPNLKAVFPEEGIGFGIDCIIIPANAPHPGNAHQLINFVLDAQMAAGVAEYQYYINPNAAADPLIDPDFLAMTPFHIPAELLATKEFVEDLGQDESLFQQIWDEFKLR